MANGYQGEITITLYDIDYLMKIDMGAIAEFQSETGEDFMHVATKALNAYYKSKDLTAPLDRAEAMTAAVSMKNAAWLFYICAKRANSHVEFGEFQEACLFEGVIDSASDIKSYPIKFVQLVEFAMLGVQDTLKKKK